MALHYILIYTVDGKKGAILFASQFLQM